MKPILFFLLIIPHLCFSQTDGVFRFLNNTKHNLKGQIHEVSYVIFLTGDGTLEGEDTVCEVSKEIAEDLHLRFSNDMMICHGGRFVFSREQEIESATLSYGDGMTLLETFYGDERIKKTIVFNSDQQLVFKEEYVYDSLKYLKSKVKLDDKGIMMNSETWYYDNLWNKVKYELKHQDNIINTQSWEYDRYGNVVKHYEEGIVKVAYLYDEKNKLIKSTYLCEGNESSEIRMDYDENNNEIISFYYNGELDYKVQHLFDDNGNLIGANYLTDGVSEKEFFATYDSQNNILANRRIDLKYKYKLDENENWIEVVVYEKGVPSYMVERNIEYYD